MLSIRQNLVSMAVCTAFTGLTLGLSGCNQKPAETPATSGSSTATTTSSSGNTATAPAENKSLAITAIVEHPALDAVRKGVLDELASEGYKEGQNLKVNFQSAQGNTATAGQIAKQFAGDNPDAIVAIGTPSAQAMVASTQTIPIVFSAITDPVEAKLVKSWEASGTNVTGGSDNLPLDPQIELIKKIIPNVKNIGYVYSPGEVNSTIVLKQLQEKLTPMGINVVPAAAQKTTDIAMATRSLQGKVDVIYTSLDNNVVSAYESMYQAAKESKIPLIAADTGSVARGAVAAMGVNYETLGHETGKLVGRIFKGEKPGTMPTVTMKNLDLYISPNHAKEVGLTLPQELISQAKEVEPKPKTK